ncbi:MAG: DUF4391 domain-containing protein [Planctomycetia bacterium]|nr:DUF4391 domain-containing protein [Planctomycetia bacterium]
MQEALTASVLLRVLDLPSACLVNQRIPKKLLLENGAPTAADKRQINDGIEELLWIAALKPTTVGVAGYRDSVREYLEIAVLRLTLRAGAKSARLIELVHRAVPYPALIISEPGPQAGLSAAHKRWAQNEADKTVLDGDVVFAELDSERDANVWPTFAAAMALGRQPRGELYALYQGWLDTLLALKAARLTGVLGLAETADQAAVRQEALRECAKLAAEIVRLRAAAAKERQMARQVGLNLELKRAEAALESARARL